MISIPEIDDFFSKKRFTQDELDTLVNQLKVTYNKQEYIKAKQYVDLKMLSFTLAPAAVIGIDKKIKKNTINREWYGLVKKKRKYYLKDLSVHLEIPEKEIRAIILKRLNLEVTKSISFGQMVKCAKLLKRCSEKHKEKFEFKIFDSKRRISVETLSKELKWSYRYLQAEIYKVSGKRYVRHLSKDDLIVLKPVIDKRRKEIKSAHKKHVSTIKMLSQDKKALKKRKQNLLDKKSQYHVYDKAQEVGGVGKLIYIRSK